MCPLAPPNAWVPYAYSSTGDSLQRYVNSEGEGLFVTRWFDLSDSLQLGLVNQEEYLTFDGINPPSLLLTDGPLQPAARQVTPSLRLGNQLIWQSEGGTFNDVRVLISDGSSTGTTTVYESTAANKITNFIQADGYVFFVADVGFRGPLDFYRYEIATSELVNFYSVPALASGNPNYSLQLLTVQNSELYFAGNLDATIGSELYRINTGVEIVSLRNNYAPAFP